jgi:hypothetical protein
MVCVSITEGFSADLSTIQPQGQGEITSGAKTHDEHSGRVLNMFTIDSRKKMLFLKLIILCPDI